MRILLFSILLSLFVSEAEAQKTSGVIKKASAFYTSMLPGMVPRGEDGQPTNPGPTINRVIYLECTGTKMPVIENVLYSNTPFKPRLTRIAENMIAVGKLSAKSKEYTILAQKGNTLWKLELEEIEGQTKVAADCRNIIVKTKVAGKISKFYIFQETQLYTPPTY